MESPITFTPSRQEGLRFHFGILAGLILLVGAFFWLAIRTPLGLFFLLFLITALTLAIPIPIIIYRLFALYRSHYIIERSGIRLRWGYRLEEIPIEEIDWVHPADDLVIPLKLPKFRWPGAIVGTTEHPDAGTVEFMAADDKDLVIIGTAKQVYAISPEDAAKFINVYQTKLEMGTISALPAFSAKPNFLLLTAWQIPAARYLLLPAFILSIAMFIWVALVTPNYETISLGFQVNGLPQEPVAAEQLFLLPTINLLLLIINIVISLNFMRSEKQRLIAPILWSGSVLTAFLFLAAIFNLLQIT